MAIGMWQSMGIIVHSYDVASHAKSFEATPDLAALDTTNLASAGWQENAVAGQGKWSMTLGAMADYDANQLDERIGTVLLNAGTIAPVTALPAGFLTGNVAYFGQMHESQVVPISAQVGELGLENLTLAGTGILVRGSLMHDLATARTATGNGSSAQIGAVPAGKKLWAALHVTEIAGTAGPSLTVKVQSDNATGFPSPTDVVTFAAKTAVGSEWATPVAGPITDDWWRVTWTISGTNPSFRFAVALGIQAA